jgi:hypothetical protein
LGIWKRYQRKVLLFHAFVECTKHSAAEFKRRYDRLKRSNLAFLQLRVAERAKKAGYPERFAQESLGTISKADIERTPDMPSEIA